MHARIALIALGSIAFSFNIAAGHGNPLSITADGLNNLKSSGLVFDDHHDSELEEFPIGSPVLIRGAAGFPPLEDGGIPAGTVISVDMAGSPVHPTALAYWNGTDLLPSPVTINLTRSGINANVGPADTFVVGGAFPAWSGTPGSEVGDLTIALPLDAPTGLYAIGFQITAPGFTRSNTFWSVHNLGLAEDEVPLGLAAITSAVPEPGSVALLSIGTAVCLACGLLLRWRRPVLEIPSITPSEGGRLCRSRSAFQAEAQ